VPWKGVLSGFYKEDTDIMESDANRWLSGALILFLFLKGFYAACEFAVVEINDAKVKGFAEKGGREGRLFKLLSKPSRLITVFSVHKVFSSAAVTFLAGIIFFEPLKGRLDLLFGGAKNVSAVVSALIIITLAAVVMSVFCDVLPKKLAEKGGDGFAVACVPAVEALAAVFYPVSVLVHFCSALIEKILGIDSSEQKDVVTEEEILMLVDAGNETGVIEESQREMINNIFEFGDLEVCDVMTHRTNLIAVDINTSISDLVYTAMNSGYSRIPVYEDSIDEIAGVVYVKDLLCLVGRENLDEVSLKDFLRDALYVPETAKCADVFKKLGSIKAQMAIVVDEYGGTAGIVTMEDLLEAIVGNMQDEYDNETEDFVKISDGVYIISGTADPGEILEKLGINLPEDHEYDTMGGFVVDLLGRIPESGETPSVVYENVEFTVLLIEDKRVLKIKAVVLNSTEEKDNFENLK